MFACPLFREFRKQNKTAKLKGANINCRPKNRMKLLQYFELYMVLIRQNKGAKIILDAKSPTFTAAKLNGFTVSYSCHFQPFHSIVVVCYNCLVHKCCFNCATVINKAFIDIRLCPGIATPLTTHCHAHYGQT